MALSSVPLVHRSAYTSRRKCPHLTSSVSASIKPCNSPLFVSLSRIRGLDSCFVTLKSARWYVLSFWRKDIYGEPGGRNSGGDFVAYFYVFTRPTEESCRAIHDSRRRLSTSCLCSREWAKLKENGARNISVCTPSHIASGFLLTTLYERWYRVLSPHIETRVNSVGKCSLPRQHTWS